MDDKQLADYYDKTKAKGAGAHYAKAGLGFASPGSVCLLSSLASSTPASTYMDCIGSDSLQEDIFRRHTQAG